MECEKMRTFDYTKLKEQKWDSEILGLVAQIHEFKGRQELYLKQKPVELDRLIEIAKVQSTESSNEIEGIRTTNTRLKQLCTDKTTPRNRDEEEIMGYRDVLNTIHENYEYIPIRSNYILQLHRDLYKYSEKNIGGNFKNTQNYISAIDGDGNEFVLFTPLAPYEVPTAINKLCEGYNAAVSAQDIDALILIPIFIHDFLCIHPFNDGNGRVSRLLTVLLLYHSGYDIVKYISYEGQVNKYKENYYAALEQASVSWHEEKNDYIPFVLNFLQILYRCFKDLDDSFMKISLKKAKKSERVESILLSAIVPISKQEIQNKLPDVSIKTIELVLGKMLKDNRITKIGTYKDARYMRRSR